MQAPRESRPAPPRPAPGINSPEQTQPAPPPAAPSLANERFLCTVGALAETRMSAWGSVYVRRLPAAGRNGSRGRPRSYTRHPAPRCALRRNSSYRNDVPGQSPGTLQKKRPGHRDHGHVSTCVQTQTHACVHADRDTPVGREGMLNPPHRTPVLRFNVISRPMHIHDIGSWRRHKESGISVFGGVRRLSRPAEFLIKVPYPFHHAYPLSD